MLLRLKQICLFILSASIVCPSVVAPQAPLSQAQEGTVLRSTTRLVQVSVIVQDGKGQPITVILQKSVAADRNATEIRVVAHDPASGATETVPVPLSKLFEAAKWILLAD